MTTQLHNIGEEFERKVLSGDLTLPATVDVLLFHDGEVSGDTTAGDDLIAADDLSAITTEPDGASYSRQSVSLDGATSWTLQQDGSSDYEMQISATLNYDLSDSANPSEVDAYGVVVNWDDGTGAADHLWWTDTLDASYSVQGTLDLNNGSLAVSGQNAP